MTNTDCNEGRGNCSDEHRAASRAALIGLWLPALWIGGILLMAWWLL